MEVLFKPTVMYLLFVPGLLSFIFMMRYILSSNNNHHISLIYALIFKKTKHWHIGFLISISIWIQLLLSIHFLKSLTIVLKKVLS